MTPLELFALIFITVLTWAEIWKIEGEIKGIKGLTHCVTKDIVRLEREMQRVLNTVNMNQHAKGIDIENIENRISQNFFYLKEYIEKNSEDIAELQNRKSLKKRIKTKKSPI